MDFAQIHYLPNPPAHQSIFFVTIGISRIFALSIVAFRLGGYCRAVVVEAQNAPILSTKPVTARRENHETLDHRSSGGCIDAVCGRRSRASGYRCKHRCARTGLLQRTAGLYCATCLSSTGVLRTPAGVLPAASLLCAPTGQLRTGLSPRPASLGSARSWPSASWPWPRSGSGSRPRQALAFRRRRPDASGHPGMGAVPRAR